MNILLVLSTESQDTFEWSLYQEAIELLRNYKIPFRTIDLYREIYDPILKDSVVNQMITANYRSLIDWASSIVFISSLSWGRMSAMMEGFLDKVFVLDYAYKYNNELLKVIPLLKKRTLFLLSEPMNSPMNTFTDDIILRSRIRKSFIAKCFTIRGRLFQMQLSNDKTVNQVLLSKALEKIRKIV